MSNIQEVANFIPAKYQKILHVALVVVGVLLGATTAGFVAIAATLPKWLVAVNAAYVYVSTAAHYVAHRNVAPESPSAPR
jgi:hypothetical protein